MTSGKFQGMHPSIGVEGSQEEESRVRARSDRLHAERSGSISKSGDSHTSWVCVCYCKAPHLELLQTAAKRKKVLSNIVISIHPGNPFSSNELFFAT